MKKVFYAAFIALLQGLALTAQTTTPTPTVSEPQVVKHVLTREMEKTIDGKKWVLTLQNDEVADLKLNGKKLPKAAWAKYQKEIDDLRSSSYQLDPEATSSDTDKMVKEAEIHLKDGGDLTPEQKAAQNAIEAEMLNDKLIGKDNYQLVLSEKMMMVNGKKMPQSTLEKYVGIYYANSGEQACEGCHFKIQVNKKGAK